MILVTGGCFQGKTDYACRTFGIPREEAVDGAVCAPEAVYTARLLYHFHEYVRRLFADGEESFVERLLQENPDIVLVTNELGCGVVPVDGFDRLYRERHGRICCALAREAAEVHRVVCGLGMVIRHG